MLKHRWKIVLFSGMGALGLGLMTWAGMSEIAKRQTDEIDELATEFLQQYPVTEKNDSAKTLDTLSAELGLDLISDGPVESSPVPGETADFQSVRDAVSDYFIAQRQKEQGPIEPIPDLIQTYLNNNQATLTQIQNHLQSQEAPVWSFDAERYTDFEYARPSYVGLVELHKLLLLKAIHHVQQNQPEQMASTLGAAQSLIKIPMDRPDLLSYLVSLLAMNDTLATMRFLESVSPVLSAQLLTVDQQQLGVDRLRFENLTSHQALTRALSEPVLSEGWPIDESLPPGLAMISGSLFDEPYLALSAANITARQENYYEQLIGKDICSIDIDVMNEGFERAIPWWNVMGQVATPNFVAQWREGGDRMLSAELTHLVVQAKALAAEQGHWPATLPNLTSQTCPDQQWVYEVSPEGEMSLSFSREFDWRVNAPDDRYPYIPLTYRANWSDG